VTGAEVIALVEDSCRELPRPVDDHERAATVVMILNRLLAGELPSGKRFLPPSAREHLGRWVEALVAMDTWRGLPSPDKAAQALVAASHAIAVLDGQFDTIDDVLMAGLAAGQTICRWTAELPPDTKIGADMVKSVRGDRAGRLHWQEAEKIWRGMRAQGLSPGPKEVWAQLEASVIEGVNYDSFTRQFAGKVREWEKKNGG
jgi:hypothetical protein